MRLCNTVSDGKKRHAKIVFGPGLEARGDLSDLVSHPMTDRAIEELLPDIVAAG